VSSSATAAVIARQLSLRLPEGSRSGTISFRMVTG
jgi:hypothetical protein